MSNDLGCGRVGAMKHRSAMGAAACALLVLAAAAWTQQPEPTRVEAKGESPSYRDVLQSYVGKKCGVYGRDGMHYLHFPEDKRMNWESGTLMAVGADFAQVRQSDGSSRYFSLTRLDVEVAPPK